MAEVRMKALDTHMLTMTEQWDIIAIQDPPPQLAFAHNLFKNHHICCRGTSPGELDAFNNPWAIAAHEKSARLKRDKGISNKLKLVPLYKVAFLVSKSIPLADWAVDWYPGEENERLLATLYLETQLPTRMALHNVYNAYYEGRTKLNVEAFISTITQTGFCLIVGDLNFPHPWYGGPHVIPKLDAVKFVNELQAAHMECLLDPTRIPFTCTPGQVIDECASTLDVGFASPAFSPHVQDYKCLDVTGFKSDHRILETTIDTTPNLREDVCYQWNNVPRKVLRQEIGPALKALASLPLETRLDIDNYIKRVVEIIICAREKLAFKRKPPQITTKSKRKPAQSKPRPQETQPSSSTDTQDTQPSSSTDTQETQPGSSTDTQDTQPSSSTDTQETQPSSSTDNDPKAGRTYENYLKDKDKEAYRRYMDIQCQNIHKASKVSAQRSMPRSFGHIPVLEERLPDNSIRKYIDFDDKAEFMVRTLFPICTCGTVPPWVFDILYLPGNLDETERARRQIKPDEIACIVQNMPAHKAEGKDGVSIDVLKMLLPLEKNPERVFAGDAENNSEDILDSEDILTSVLQRPMQACLNLSYHPEAFKEAVTVMIRKKSKLSSSAEGYRPIALLSAIAKIFERLFADRLTDFLIESTRLLLEQFGGRGKSATQALEFLVEAVYRNWFAKKEKIFVTICALDITGAYDRVRRQHLLNILVRYGVPGWMVKFVASFLSSRSTTVRVQGRHSKKFSINIGIPQGSPLSPILFIFFTLPLLEKLKAIPSMETNRNARLLQLKELLITTFVDDITLLVASPSIKQNNEALAILYELLTEFAALNGTEFGPHKTKVMHMLQRGPAITDMPKVDGFPPKAVESMEILGVTLDYRLNWVEHVNNVLSKVRRKMFLLRRISATTWGASISELRTRYITAVRPIVAYACPVWFVLKTPGGPPCNWTLAKSVVNLLETQQNNCLRQISGAFPRASGHALCKELYIERMSVFLHRCARAYRASNKGTPEGMALCNLWERNHKRICVNSEVLQRHPYCVAYHEANTLLRVNAQIQLAVEIQTWTEPPDSVRGTAKRAARLKQIIKSLAKDLAEQRMKESWIEESNKRRCLLGKLAYDAPTWKGTYGKHNLEAYKPLRKAQGTILLGIKTGINGLNKPLFDMHIFLKLRLHAPPSVSTFAQPPRQRALLTSVHVLQDFDHYNEPSLLRRSDVCAVSSARHGGPEASVPSRRYNVFRPAAQSRRGKSPAAVSHTLAIFALPDLPTFVS
ncbi:putative RNA-directed DNA polymerase from transposon BS [Colletotrichum siamense]|uniref:putative RNA-directed DNA polymerase from transposon BS n=1 Tax=Colletotrichum siamense TaxID=690259 RepID=UPI001872F446|nr:putative RNA-directed DNA polymerase from transposon BS [Colletotrichum siamense]KAF5489627.1 putative RNA-directed DNA polymerase from transposon BS [Colletotrichum siamense]